MFLFQKVRKQMTSELPSKADYNIQVVKELKSFNKLILSVYFTWKFWSNQFPHFLQIRSHADFTVYVKSKIIILLCVASPLTERQIVEVSYNMLKIVICQ